MTYDEARAWADAALICDGAPLVDSDLTVVRAHVLRTLLAGPPEPTEPVAWSRLDIQRAMKPVRDYLLKAGVKHRVAEEAAERATDVAFAYPALAGGVPVGVAEQAIEQYRRYAREG
jgi:hypothetical protein